MQPNTIIIATTKSTIINHQSTISLTKLSIVATIITYITIFASWISYGIGYGTFFPVPTVSTTFNFPPFNFLSRVVIGFGATCFGLFHLAIYYSTHQRQWSSLLLFLGLAGSFCLAMLGAICSSRRSPECMGELQWHLTSAFAFFIFQDAFQIGISIRDRHEKSVKTKTTTILLITLISLIKYIYYCHHYFTNHHHDNNNNILHHRHDPPGAALMEWINITIILSFMMHYIHNNCPHVTVGFFDLIPSSSSNTATVAVIPTKTTNNQLFIPLWSFSGTFISGLVMFSGFILILVTYSICIERGDFPVFPHHVPEISNLFIYNPGNYLSRLFGVQSSIYFGIFLIMAMRVVLKHNNIANTKLLRWYTLSFLSIGKILVIACVLSLAFSLCVNNVESNYYHTIAVKWLFSSWTILLIGWFAPFDWRCTVFTAFSLFTKIRFLIPMDWNEIFNSLEFGDVLVSLSWVGIFGWFHGNAMNKACFGLLLSLPTVLVVDDGFGYLPLIEPQDDGNDV
jgi:hypothetical protein